MGLGGGSTQIQTHDRFLCPNFDHLKYLLRSNFPFIWGEVYIYSNLPRSNFPLTVVGGGGGKGGGGLIGGGGFGVGIF